MKFQTSVEIPSLEPKINYSNTLLSMGSCFAEEMGKRLEINKFQILTNPFGIAYNPISIFRLIEIGLGSAQPRVEMHPRLNYAFSFDLHSHLGFQSLEQLSLHLDKLKAEFVPWMEKLDFLVLTFGTAHIYEEKDGGQLVNNCHKFPSSHFSRRMLSPHEIADAFHQVISPLWKGRPNLQVILTVSPVRHVRDGLTVNSLSKSILRYSCDIIQAKDPRVHYFPSFEIMVDELRDYRFYKEDMFHPSEQAIGIIWKKFIQASLSTESLNLLSKWKKILAELNHRPIHPWSEEYFSFLKNLLKKVEDITKMGINATEERVLAQKSIDHWRSKYSTMQKK